MVGLGQEGKPLIRSLEIRQTGYFKDFMNKPYPEQKKIWIEVWDGIEDRKEDMTRDDYMRERIT